MNKLLLFILLFPAVVSFIAFLVGKKNDNIRNAINIIASFINLVVIIYLYNVVKVSPLEISVPYIMGTGLHLKLNLLRYLFVFITAFIWFIVNIYSSQYLIQSNHKNRYYLFFILTYASTIGFFISENLLNLFTFFEIMSLSAYPLIIHDEDENAHDAGRTYISMTIAGGLILLMGIFILYTYTSSLDIGAVSTLLPELGNIKYLISILLIIGFGVKAGMIPFHIWLPKAYVAAPTPASAVLTGVLAKIGIFGILMTTVFLMKGDIYLSYLLVFSGFTNMLVGGFLALFQNNIKKTLAYSSLSQMGYLILGIGLIGVSGEFNALAVFGTLFHILNHAVFKVMLFMGVGIIYMITRKLDINEIYGFGTFKPVLKLTFFIGFCAIIGMPGFNGYASKTLLHHALTEAGHNFNPLLMYFGEFLYYLSGALTTAYLLKLYIALFVENNSRYYASYSMHINKRALFPMVISAAIILYFGFNPKAFIDLFGNVSTIFVLDMDSIDHLKFYSIKNVLSSFVTIGIGVLIYFKFVLKKLRIIKDSNRIYINPSLEWFSFEKNIYLPIINFLFKYVFSVFKYVDNLLLLIVNSFSKAITYVSNVEFTASNSLMYRLESSFSNLYLKLKEKSNPKNKESVDFFSKITGSSTKLNKMFEETSSEIKSSISDSKTKINVALEETSSEFKQSISDSKNKLNKSLENTNNASEAKTTISKDFKSLQDKFNSITYSIYLLGAFLVIILLAVLIFKS